MPDHHPTHLPADESAALDSDWNRAAPSNHPERLIGTAVDRLSDRLNSRLAFVIGPAGTGKTALVRAWAQHVRGPVEWITLTPSHGSLNVLQDALRVARAAAPSTVVIDNAHIVAGAPAECAIEQFVTDAAGTASVVICARSLPAFASLHANGTEEVITGRDLALRLDEITEVFHAIHRRHLGLEAASAVMTETGGWPALVHLLAHSVHGFAPDGLDDAVCATIGGDYAEGFLAGVFTDLAPGLRTTLASCSTAPAIDFAASAAVMGADSASALVTAVESGVILTDHRAGAERRLPGALRRHLIRHLPTERRPELGGTTACSLLESGDLAGAAATLHDSGCLPDLIALLRAEPEVFGIAGGMPWALSLPDRALCEPLLRAARARALLDDRYAAAAREQLLLIDDGDADAASVRRRLLIEISGTSASAGSEVRTSATTTRAAPWPAALDPVSLLATAGQRMRAGAITEAVPLLQRIIRAQGARRTTTLAARLALAVTRSAVASTADTTATLCAIEGEASVHGLSGLARVARGALAAATGRQSAVAAAVAECEERGDGQGAAAISGIDLLVRLRSRRATPATAGELAARLAGIGEDALAAWADGTAALLGADQHHADARRFVTAAESSGIREALPALRPIIDAARALLEHDRDQLNEARRAALATGLPRLPLAVGIRGPSTAPATRTAGSVAPAPTLESPRRPRFTVICFGGFRMQVDGADLDLRGVRPQARALLRMLALNAGSPVHRELIAGILWGDLGTTSAVHALHVSISSLRRALGAGTGSLPAEILERRGEAYALTLGERRNCDLVDFDDHLTRATEASRLHDLDAATDSLSHAITLYTGEVLPEDGPAEWATGARDRYRLRAAGAAASLAQLELRRGRTHAAVVAAERSVEIDPWLDNSWRTLVAVHRTSGDVVASQRAEQGYRRMRVSLGVD